MLLQNDLLLRALRREPTERTPVWIMRQAGRYLPQYRAVRAKADFLTLCKTPDLAAEVTIQPVDELGVDAAIIFSDILIPVQAMGMALELGDHGPKLPSPIASAADVARLHSPDPESETGFVMEAIRRTVKSLAGRVPLIGFCGAPFTLASYMIEGGGSKNFLATKRFLFEQPQAARALFDLLADSLGVYLAAQARAGASALQIFDSWGGELSPADYETWGVPYLQRMVAAAQKEKVPVIMFCTGSAGMLERLAKVGADAVGLDWRIELDVARARLGPKLAVQGNLDPCALFLPPEQLEARVRDVLARGGGTGHVFNLGHGILPPTPPEAARRLVRLVHELSERPRA